VKYQHHRTRIWEDAFDALHRGNPEAFIERR
jgi:hypothetical protein